ncbi:hypothetical protein B5E48_01705 [Massilimicrobiota sp. An105]|uniref:HNH endonuclease n=1 Tax=Massilimicrobiota sp. An105 TaxID=1965540 RepID=UPI000B3AFD47|nr:HNH endonuclease [Massilimicrobiota sp. An105]OUQ84138.1 hypothetical protein B5E48_01705 [Massilimicrobiota sp. An105]
MNVVSFNLIKKYTHVYKNNPIKLVPGDIYQSGSQPNAGRDQISKLMGVSNSSGMRTKNIKGTYKKAYLVLIMKANHNNWNDKIIFNENRVIYYGDNYKSKNIYDTKHNGNKNLKFLFGNADNPYKQYPIFLFYHDSDCEKSSDLKYAGLCIPNYKELGLEFVESNGVRNYKANFTLIQEIIDLGWLEDLQNGINPFDSDFCPLNWKNSIENNTISDMTIKTLVNEEINISQNFDSSNPESVEKYIQTTLKARKGQGAFRKKLLKHKRCQCELCQVNIPDLLLASHIKPFSKCTAQEAYDLNNGLVLCATHDALFDKGYISFNTDGKILISNLINTDLYDNFNIDNTLRININPKEKKYMKYHNKHVFIKT